jgi:hypothetical protein
VACRVTVPVAPLLVMAGRVPSTVPCT